MYVHDRKGTKIIGNARDYTHKLKALSQRVLAY